MFIGHFALAFAAKRAAPRVSLGMLFGAAQFADLLWPFLVAFGIEQVRIDPGNTAFTPLDFVSYPYSHSLLLLVVWGIVIGWLYRSRTRNTAAFLLLAALVISHWILDFIVHRSDLPLYPGGPKVGLGLWNSVTATIVVEAAMYAFGVWLYVRATRPRDGTGRWAFASLAIFLVVLFVANIFSTPPSVPAIYVSAIVGGGLLLAWAQWADRHRTSTT
jgi:hypothetical protein